MRTINATISLNRSAKFNYHILEKFVAGISLNGAEVKSMRANSVSISESFVDCVNFEMWILGMHVPIYKNATQPSIIKHFDPTRKRKLLLKKNQIIKLSSLVKTKGLTVIPLKIFFNGRSLIKVEIGLCKGKKLFDKRRELKQKAIALDLKQSKRGK